MSSSSLRAARALLVLILLTACADGASAPTLGARRSDASLGAPPPAASLGASLSEEYVWSAGSRPTSMGLQTDHRICLMTYVRGTFAGSGDAVYAFNYSGAWELRGTSTANDLTVRARCYSNVQFIEDYFEVSVGAGTATVAMASPPYTCGINAINGRLATPNDGVEIYLSSGPSPTWTLRVSQDTLGPGAPSMLARGRCFIMSSQKTSAFVWAGSGTSYPPATPLWSTIGDSFCYLAGLEGRFQGSTSYMQVSPTTTGWSLVGGPSQPGSIGKALCARRFTWTTTS